MGSTATAPASTATTTAAREHARAQAGAITDSMPVVPASRWPAPPAGVPAHRLLHAETIPAGRYTTVVLGRGARIRLTDTDGTACAALMMWRADAPWERLNTADTVKVPWQAYLGEGHPLLSDQGRVLATIVADDGGRHDALCGVSTAAGNEATYGSGQPESGSPAGFELLLLGALKNGLTVRDLPHPISLFRGVSVAPDGALELTGNAGPNTSVELVTHLPVVAAIASANHPLDPAGEYRAGPLELLAWEAADDLAQLVADETRDPEYRRAVANSEAAHHSRSATAPPA